MDHTELNAVHQPSQTECWNSVVVIEKPRPHSKRFILESSSNFSLSLSSAQKSAFSMFNFISLVVSVARRTDGLLCHAYFLVLHEALTQVVLFNTSAGDTTANKTAFLSACS